MNLLNLDDLEVDVIDQCTTDLFEKSNSINTAKAILEEINSGNYDYRYSSKNVLYEDDLWTFYSELYQHHIHFDFDELDSYFRFSNPEVFENIKDAIKCWTCDLINDYSPQAARKFFRSLTLAIQATSGLTKEYASDFVNNLNDRLITVADKTELLGEYILRDIMLAMENFCDYFRFESLERYIEGFQTVRAPEIEKNTRKIPGSKDCYTFDYYLHRWCEDVKQTEDSKELVHFYPIYLWWKVTSILPIRPTEFINIKQMDCFKKDGKCYIKVKRIKQKKNAKKIQVPDTLRIPGELYEDILHYMEISEPYGESDTLISYRAIKDTRPSSLRGGKKLDPNKTNSNVLKNLLKAFYTKILAEKYNLVVKEDAEQHTGVIPQQWDIERRLRLNDSRHIAITSMMLQGYDKVQIARLSGHTSLKTQYGYYNHVEFWVDSEVKRLSEEFAFSSIRGINSHEYNPQLSEMIEQFSVKSWTANEADYIYKLNLGHCADKEMSCPSGFNPDFSGCYHCPFWRIKQDELEANSELIKKELNTAMNTLKSTTSFLVQLHKQSDLDAAGEVNPALKTDLITASKQLKKEIIDVSKIQQLYNLLR